MSIDSLLTGKPSGFRRLTPPMLNARERADQFAGVAKSSGDRFKFLAAFQEAEPYLGLPSHAYKLVSWLVGQTMPHDWEPGNRPIAWPSARLQQEFLGLSSARVKALNRALYEAGIFVIRDNEQGKRYGRRDANKRIIEAYGFDLSPLALRHEEFIHFAAEAKAERSRMKDLRRRVTIARRTIRAIGEMLESIDAVPEGWSRLAADVAALVATARTIDRSNDMAMAVKSIEGYLQQAEILARRVSEPVDSNPKGLDSKLLTTSTNQSFNPKDTVIASEESKGAGSRIEPKSEAADMPQRSYVGGIRKPEQLLDLAPRLAQYIFGNHIGWREIVDAAGGQLRHELGVSASLWSDACRIMGRERAALALAIVSTKPESHFARSAGGYFGGMVKKAEKGELHLEKTLWALREAKYGKLNRSRSTN